MRMIIKFYIELTLYDYQIFGVEYRNIKSLLPEY